MIKIDSAYSRKLDDFRWREVVQQVKIRDRFCQDCRTTERLVVHHLRYTRSNPWDEPLENLVLVCKKCHAERHKEHIPGVNPALTLACSLVKRAEPIKKKTIRDLATEEVFRNIYYEGKR